MKSITRALSIALTFTITLSLITNKLAQADTAYPDVEHAADASSDFVNLGNIQTGANFLSGGIGREEVEAMRGKAKHYPLQILLSEGKRGSALIDVALSITNASGATVFQFKQAGPLLYVKLPAGLYKVTGESNGVVKTQHVNLPADGKSQRLYLNWPSVVEEVLEE